MFQGSLRAFNETVRSGSIRKASEVLGVAPSSVSRHIAILEREMGTSLFTRQARGVELTHAGELVAEFARTVLAEYDALRTDLNDFRGEQRRLLRIAVVESVAHYGPISAVAAFRANNPFVSFNVQVIPAPGVTKAIQEGRCDIGVAYCAERHHDLVFLESIPEPIVLALREDHALASKPAIGLEDLKYLMLALPDADFGLRQILDRASAAAGFRITPVLTSNVFETLRDFVRLGMGAAVLPRRAAFVDGQSHGLVIRELEGPPFSNATIDIIVGRRRLPRIVRAFVTHLIKEISQLNPQTL